MAQAAIVSMYATKMWFWMDAYQDDFYLTETSALTSPDSWFAWHVKAVKRWEGKSHQEALIFWMMARAISPNEFKLNLNIATILRLSNDKNHHEQSKQFFEVARNNIPRGQEEQCNRLLDDWKEGRLTILV
jgi:hypothetical protein